MTNKQFIENFLDGEEVKTGLRYIQDGCGYYKGRTLYTKQTSGDTIQLINYSTVIAILHTNTNTLELNVKKYSCTTSRIQGLLRFLASQKNIQIVEFEK